MGALQTEAPLLQDSSTALRCSLRIHALYSPAPASSLWRGCTRISLHQASRKRFFRGSPCPPRDFPVGLDGSIESEEVSGLVSINCLSVNSIRLQRPDVHEVEVRGRFFRGSPCPPRVFPVGLDGSSGSEGASGLVSINCLSVNSIRLQGPGVHEVEVRERLSEEIPARRQPFR